ncbi:MAG TPA: ATP-binding protein [Bryobacteraceae bacterium]|nr:ATP-binding protein [Bryobacteraceae bacterium]
MPAKRLLRDKDKKFRLLFAEHPQPMWILDAQSHELVAVNAAALSLYGYSPDEAPTLTLAAIQSPEETRRFFAQLHDPKRPAASAWRHRTKSGRLIDVEIEAHPIQYGGRQAELAVLMDITSRRELEDRLRQAQRMEAVGMLTGGVAHDFNNLLTIISGYSQLILSKLPPSDPSHHLAEQIVKAGERAAELTRQLLAFSRRRVLQSKVLSLNYLVASLSTMLQRLIGEDIELRLELGDDLGSVQADPGQIEQVLLNLVANGRDAMPKGGVLTVRTANATLEGERVGRLRAVKSGDYVLLAVNDTGAGMDQATQARLFEPFFTTKNAGAGTGLGLFTVAGIVRQSGGAVDAVSELGQGTTFRVFLPRVDQAAKVEPEAPKKAAARGAETILLVEDDEMVRTLVRETLEAEGYQVLDASDALEAHLMAECHRGTIQLLITDVVMPKASGPELARTLSHLRPDLKVLYISGHNESTLLKRGVRRKEAAFLPKPFTPGALAAKVREVLEHDSTPRHSRASS